VKTRGDKLRSYAAYVEGLLESLDHGVKFHYIPRDKNRFADALVILASMVEVPNDTLVRPLVIKQRTELAYYHVILASIDTPTKTPWYTDFL